MPEADQLSLDDDEDYTQLLASYGEGLQPTAQSKLKVSPRRNQKAPACFSPISLPGTPNEEVDFIDRYLDHEVLNRWFSTHKAAFLGSIFPQFLVPILHSPRFEDLFPPDDAATFAAQRHAFGDLDNPSERERVYKSQSTYLYDQLTRRITKRPSLIYDFIAALRADNWNQPLADLFESEVRSWRKKMTAQLQASTPAFPLPTPVGPRASQPVHVIDSQALPPPPAAMSPLFSKPQNLLFNIPEPISYFVPRPKKSNDLLDHLRAISKKGHGWLVLYGMGGSGKTTLAASTVRRQHELDPSLFSDGIFWLTIGNLTQKSEDSCPAASTTTSTTAAEHKNQLLLKMELLAELLRPFDRLQQFSTTKFDQIPTAVFRFKRHFEHHRRSLLILDDVWSSEVVESFQLGIPILVTTREASICSKYLHNVVPVSILSKDDGAVLTFDESIDLLYKCLNMPPNDLVKMEHLQENFYVKKIIDTFRGLPYCIPLIANCMETFYAVASRTEFGLRYKLKLSDDSDEEEDICRTPCYENWKQLYNDIVNNESVVSTENLVKASIKSLDEPLKSRLYDFVIFVEAVPFAVFQTLWSDLGSDVKIMDILMKLVNKSLIIKTVNGVPGSTAGGARAGTPRGIAAAGVTNPAPSASFGLHSITLNFLKKELKKEEIKERHSKLIQAYLNCFCRSTADSTRCTYDYARLPNDHYIYHNLAYHIYSAERWHLFAPIFLNLRFAANKIAQVGPSDLLNDYIDFRRYFDRADSQKLSDYQSFIASNSSELCEPNVDILQTALCQPDSSAVYKEAASLVANNSAAHPSRAYFDWCNKRNCSNEAPPKLISFKCLPEVNCATYSPDCRHIATVSGKTLQIWNGITGELVCRLDDQHREQINHCVFSRNGQYLLTSADDGTAIMWQNLSWFQQRSSSADHAYHHGQGLSSSMGSLTSTRNSRSASIDFIDSTTSGSPSNQHSFDVLDSSTTPDPEALYLQHQQRRRRSSGNGGHPNANGTTTQFLTRYTTFDLKMCKLKADTIAESSNWTGFGGGAGSGGFNGAHTIKCGDISADNRYVLTGNGAGNLHLWSVADAQQITSPLLLFSEEATEADDAAKVVECCSFSGDSRFILGLVGTTVYIYSITDQTVRSQTELHVIGGGGNGANGTGPRVHFQTGTPPQSPRLRRGKFTVQLCRKLVHSYKVYNAFFHPSGTAYYPAVFTSSDKYIFEWDLDSSKSRTGSFLDFDDDEEDLAAGGRSAGIKLTAETRKYSTTLSSQHSGSSHSSHLSFAAISRSGSRIAGFEHTRNEIYMWNRGDETAGWGFGSRSPSPVSGGCCPSSTLLRCQANIVSLAFSNDEERLLGCCRSGEITVWDIGKNVNKTSIVDLKKQFAASFADDTDDSTVSVLTIDTKGFLRQFNGLEGDENRPFSLDLRKELAQYRGAAESNVHLLPISPLRLDITTCDIAPTGEIIFGTNAGDVFFYEPTAAKVGPKLHRQMHGHAEKYPEAVTDCQFIPSTPAHFITVSDKCLSFFAKTTTTAEGHHFTKRNIPLTFVVEKLNEEAGIVLSTSEHIKIDSFKLHPALFWLVFWSNAGHLFIFNYAEARFIFQDYLNDVKITSVDFSAPDDTKDRRQIMMLSRSDKMINVYRIRYSPDVGMEVARGHVFSTHPVLPRTVRIAPNKRFFIVGDDDGGLTRRSTDTKPLGKIDWTVPTAHTAWVHDLVISPDQQYILSASESVKLWNALDGTLLQSFLTHGNVCRLVTRFPSAPDSNNNPLNDRKPKVTVVTVTDASTLYILRTLN